MAGALAAAARPGDVVITVGAGDVTLTARELLDLLNARQ
jgi:UDP-N-acetylmuramate--alanine ligase